MTGDCGFPGQPLNGLEDILHSTNQVKDWTFANGTNVTFKCSDLHLMVGQNVRTCQSNGTWSHSVPQCSKYFFSFLTIWNVKIYFLKKISATNVANKVDLRAENLSAHSENASLLIDGYETNCHVQFQPNTSLHISLKHAARIYGIKFISFGSDESRFLSHFAVKLEIKFKFTGSHSVSG